MGWKRTVRHTYLILHHCIANIFHKTVEHLCVPGIVQEPCSPPLFHERGEISANILQFPDNRCASDLALYLGEYGITVPVSSSSPSPWYHP